MNIGEPEKPIDLPVVYRHSAIATNGTPSGHYRTNLARGNVQLGKSKSALDLASSKFEYNPNGESPTIETTLASLFANGGEGAETPAEESGDPPPLPPKPVAVTGIYETDNGRRTSSINPSYDISKGIAESAMDISLLTANANQLRLLITYNQGSKTYVACITFVILSLVLQMMVAITMIVVSLTKPERDDPKRQRVKIVTSIGVAIITMINILVASLVVAEQPPDAIVASTAGVVGMLTNINITDTAAGT